MKLSDSSSSTSEGSRCLFIPCGLGEFLVNADDFLAAGICASVPFGGGMRAEDADDGVAVFFVFDAVVAEESLD